MKISLYYINQKEKELISEDIITYISSSENLFMIKLTCKKLQRLCIFFHGRPPSCLEFSLKHVTSDLD